ncbi:hypothetical protein HN51_023411 [Arachis hypogaea]|uniref:MATH domain-containing protein n=1 Tax=Arachis hypogaea TaxID=3818 RepID=A0A445E5N9_ARAHY|nr:MATH domain and coiled-coil domain-containing protein At3g58440-like [Arachis hypogaea]QHO26241.1 Ubiquitin carboxyl-terminal hydrolase [Arachis hypogaea]RYR70625.1 hypothetical protein Ahy_A02g004960 [Arachis hypogaea]
MEVYFRVETIVKFTWTIENFYELVECRELHSETFFTGSYPWRIMITPKAANTGKGLSIYLDAVDIANAKTRSACFKLSLINEFCRKKTKTRTKNRHLFSSENVKFGYKSFISSDEFLSPNNGFLVDNTCTIVAEVFGYDDQNTDTNDDDEEHDDENTDTNDDDDEEEEEDDDSPKDTVLVDFKGLCRIEKEFVQLLEKVCSRRPNLVESHRKRNMSQKFNEWSFTTLGKVLQFLKTKKVKDMMNDDACKELQYLWEELEIVKFDDLSWLKEHVESALGMKNYMERGMKVKRLKGNVVALEGEVKSLKEKMIVAERDLEKARRELVKEEEGYVARDLNDELACEIL